MFTLANAIKGKKVKVIKLLNSEISSKLLENAVSEFGRLPGVGQKTALRLVLHLLKQSDAEVARFTSTINQLKEEIQYCHICFNISDYHECEICTSPKRDHSIICVVEDTRDVMAIENTGKYRGKYLVLGGKISPMEGIGPGKLNISSIEKRLEEGIVQELIFALSATMEGDTTAYFIYKKFKNSNVKFSTIARGISVGDELEYADEISLGRSIQNRLPYNEKD